MFFFGRCVEVNSLIVVGQVVVSGLIGAFYLKEAEMTLIRAVRLTP